MTPSRFLRVGRGYSRTTTPSLYGWASITRRRWFARRERAAATGSSLALSQSPTREMPDTRKAEGTATTPIRDHGTQSTTLRKRKVGKLFSCHECTGTG